MADDYSAPDRVAIELSSSRIDVVPGATPVEVTLVVRNDSRVVDQCTIEVVGLDADWFTLATRSVALFPGDSERLAINFHVPVQSGLRAGAHPFRVVVRSRSTATEQQADGVVAIRGEAAYEMDLAPRRQVGKRGHFRVQLTNSGLADGVLELSATDSEEGLTFRFLADQRPLVPAHSTIEVPLVALPRRRPWVGPDHTYEFVVKARRPDNLTEIRNVNGQFVHHPRFASLGLLRRLVVLVGAVAALVAVLTLMPADLRCRLVGENGAIPFLGSGCGTGSVALTGGTAAAPAAQPTGGIPARGGATQAAAVGAGGGGGAASPVAEQQAAGLGAEAIGGGGGPAGAGMTAEGVPTPVPPAATAAALFMAGVDATQVAAAAAVATPTLAPATTLVTYASPSAAAVASSTATVPASSTPTPTARAVVAQFQPGACSQTRQPPATPTPARAQAKPSAIPSPAAYRPVNEWSQSDPTAWSYCSGVTADQLTQVLKSSQSRLIDVEVEQAQPTLLLSAVLVANQGAYARDWWWYYGLDDVQVQERLTTNNARPISLRAYDAAGNTRFAVVMVSNKAPDTRTYWWFPDLAKPLEIDHMLMVNKARLTDVDPHVDQGNRRFAVVMIASSGADRANSWRLDNVTPDQIGAEVTRTGGQVIDIEPDNVAAGTFDVVLEACPCAKNWWATSLDEAGLATTLTQTGGRMTSLATYLVNNQRRFALSLIDNS